MTDSAKRAPKPAEASSGEKSAPGRGAAEGNEEAARRQVRALLVKILLNASRDFEEAAYKLGKR